MFHCCMCMYGGIYNIPMYMYIIIHHFVHDCDILLLFCLRTVCMIFFGVANHISSNLALSVVALTANELSYPLPCKFLHP